MFECLVGRARVVAGLATRSFACSSNSRSSYATGAPPDLLVYAEADPAVIATRIAERGRPEEQPLDTGYLSLLAELYDELVDSWRLSRVYRLDTTRVDVRHEDGFQLASRRILELLP